MLFLLGAFDSVSVIIRGTIVQLVTPDEIFIAPESWQELVQSVAGADLEELSLTPSRVRRTR